VLKAKKLFKNEYFVTALIIALMIVIVVGFFFGSQVFLNTSNPVVTVESGSMCIPYDGACDGWGHPFDRTLHVGDILIIQGLKNPDDYNANYPNSDIIVYQDKANDRMIVHRIVAEHVVNGTLYFYTKGDGNSPGYLWPTIPPSYKYDTFTGVNGVSSDLVVGKVVARIPWIGHITLFMDPKDNPYGRPIVIGIIALLVIVEFVLPLAKKKSKPEQQNSPPQPV
jgi:hypothetical protein